MQNKSPRPRIGVTLDSEKPGGYSQMPWYALRQNYCDTIVAAGGIPIPLPHEPDLAQQYLELIDGLVITGGAFDIDPQIFGSQTRHSTVTTKDKRTAFELAITRLALDKDLPILGICGGEQLLAVALGGTLVQHIPDHYPNCIEHEQKNPRSEPGHTVQLTEGTWFAKMAADLGLDQNAIPVNSAHHQSVETVGDSLEILAIASDGVIEAIGAKNSPDHPKRKFCLGLQWHPEFLISKLDQAIYHQFIQAAK